MDIGATPCGGVSELLVRGYVNARRYGVMPPYRWGRIWRDEGIAPYRRGRIWRQMAVGTFLHT